MQHAKPFIYGPAVNVAKLTDVVEKVFGCQNSSKTGLEMPIGYSTIAYGASNRVVFPAEVSSPAQSDFFNSI
jgi:hypothetical protein